MCQLIVSTPGVVSQMASKFCVSRRVRELIFKNLNFLLATTCRRRGRKLYSTVLGINIVQKPGIYEGSDNRLVSFAGRLILVKHTLSAISIHLFSVFRAPAYFCFKSEKYCYQFLWKKGTSKGVCWKLSETLSCASP